jgi:cyclopropane fatty-acyl-phospholipid synthase-like methyltransferase
VFTTDSIGRRLGNYAWKGKRQEPQSLSDPRIAELLRGLRGNHILEVGCLEGVHTIGLCMKGCEVTAIDARIENLVKTQIRSLLYGCHPKLMLVDLDQQPNGCKGGYDACFHVGVLYHLENPVEHLLDLLPSISEAILIDTHVANDTMILNPYPGHVDLLYADYKEYGRNDIFSGMGLKSKWLTSNSLKQVLMMSGFQIDAEERRDERNGPRVKIRAVKTTSTGLTI